MDFSGPAPVPFEASRTDSTREPTVGESDPSESS